mmetsp:Transcript_55193/g.103470  ORF Transcript_55193/g.103470 Transcript_55193/m.103470 type:complete len:131 (-) Transcript_55193:220-612(-)
MGNFMPSELACGAIGLDCPACTVGRDKFVHAQELHGDGCFSLKLDGQWYRSTDLKRVGEIDGDLIIWNLEESDASSTFDLDTEGHGVSRLKQVDETGLLLEVAGMQFAGSVRYQAQAVITWCDGEVWLRK